MKQAIESVASMTLCAAKANFELRELGMAAATSAREFARLARGLEQIEEIRAMTKTAEYRVRCVRRIIDGPRKHNKVRMVNGRRLKRTV